MLFIVNNINDVKGKMMDNTHKLQRVFAQIIKESEGDVQSDTASDSVNLPNNREDLTKVMFGEKIDIPNYDKLNDNTKVFIIEKSGNGPHDTDVTSVANISTYHGRLYLNYGGNFYRLKNNHEIDTYHSHLKKVEDVYSEAMTYGDLKNNVKQFIDQLDFKDEGYRFLTKGGHILHGVMIDKPLYNDDYCLFLTWDINTCPRVKKRNNNRRKYKMSDGNTIIYVNPDDVYDAKKDGFHIVSEDGKEGHRSASNSDFIHKFHDNDFNYALEKIDLHDTREVLIKLCRVIIDILQWGDCPKLLKKLREEFGKNGDSVDRIILDALEKELNDEKTKLHKYRIDWHNENPKHTSHPDKIDVKKMKKPNLPNE